MAKGKGRPRGRRSPEQTGHPEDRTEPAAAPEELSTTPLAGIVRRSLGAIPRGLGRLANTSPHLALGILCVLSAGILLWVAGPRAGSFVPRFMAVQIVAGLALCWWGVSRLRDPNAPPSRLDQLKPARFFLETWRRMDDEARQARVARAKAGLGWDWHPILALCAGAVCLTLMEYFGGSRTFDKLLDSLHGDALEPTFWSGLAASPFSRLYEFAWWSGWRVLGYLLIPSAVILLTRQRWRDQGLRTRGFSEHAWIYGVAYCIVLVCVVIVSYTAEFSEYYPFYKLATRSGFDFLVWEALYAAQFFSLEFFFRGWWLASLKPTMGSHAIFAMVVPYCMIHYGKPFPETMAAIVAGLVLGTLAMKTRSIWSGFLIHVSVAVSMDMAALLQTTGMPDRWWPDL